MKLIIAIDDTDNLESRGTGHLARELAASLERENLIFLENVVRHQLLVHPQIPYTSHNSSASIVANSKSEMSQIIDFCTEFLLKESAEGSDVGLCVAEFEKISENIISWGKKAKTEVLTKEKAHQLADSENIFLTGLTGKKIGVIGSLAAVGLRKEGNDGRILWLRNLRETTGIFSAAEICENLSVEKIQTIDYQDVDEKSLILLTEWTRPVMRDEKVTLIVQNSDNNEKYQYIVASKEFIKSISE